MRLTTICLAAALALTACTAGGTVVDPGDEPSDSSSATEITASTSSTVRPSAAESASPFTPVNAAQPGGAAPGSVASLEVVEPDTLGVALVSVDPEIGAVSWWDGFGWQSFDVDVALDSDSWATDGRGGLVIQADLGGSIWHLEPFSDEPTLIVEPPDDGSVYMNLVGAGIVDTRQYAFVEQSTFGSPETATGDILGFDLIGRGDRVLFAGTSGWESGTGQLHLVDGIGVMTVHAECYSGAVIWRLGDPQSENLASGPDCSDVLTGLGEVSYRGLAALAVVGGDLASSPDVLVSRTLDEWSETIVQALPLHDQPWQSITSTGERVLISANGVAIVESDQGPGWARLNLTVPGVVMVADDLAVG